MRELTLLLIKPNAIRKKAIGDIIGQVEANNFEIVRLRMLQMDETRAERFYHVHKDKPFYENLVKFMTSGKTVAVILCKGNGVEELRCLVGDTDPVKAAENTIRKKFGDTVTFNAVHASDSRENALREIKIIFPEINIEEVINENINN